MDLLKATNQEIQASGIKIAKKVEQPDNPYKRTGQFFRNQNTTDNQNDNNNSNRTNDHRNSDRPSDQPDRPDRPDRIDDTNQYAFPAEHPNSLQFYKHLKELKEQGKTKEDILSTYKTPYTDPGCFICCLKEGHSSFHTDTECRQLKHLYPYSLPLGSCSLVFQPPLQSFSTPCNKPNTTQQHKHHETKTSQVKLCYNTGTVPGTLTGNRDIFASYKKATTPEYVLLGDGTTTMPILGSGIIDIIVNNHRIQIPAKHVKQQ